MKILTIVGISVASLVGLFLILGLFLPKEMKAERSRVIDATPEQIFAAINDFNTWDKWSPWKEKDPTMQMTPGEQMQGPGASYSWTSEDQGNGKQRIVSAEPPRALQTSIAFEGMGEANGNWTLTPTEAGTQVSWGFQSDIPYPWNALVYFQGGEAAVGKDFDRGLELLEKYVKENPPKMTEYSQQTPAYEVKEIDLEARHYLIHREVIDMAKVNDFFPAEMPKLGIAMAEQKLTINGTPSGLIFSWDEEKGKTDIAVGIPTPPGTKLKGYTNYEVPAGKALSIDYYGPYEGTGAAHEAMGAYLAEKKMEAKGVIIEEYVTDPEAEADPNAWLTRIIYVL